MRKLLCRFGFHQWYVDAAMYNWARRCNYCGQYQDQDQGRALEQERERWSRR